jgi:tRNA threonylcarbamoyladenosine biosynthesis protein TsaB
MKTIALETSATPGAIALLDDAAIVYEKDLPEKRRTTETFSPQLQDALQQAGWRPSDVGLFAVCAGPGSFTGLRIGITVAKTFAYVTGCSLVALNTLELLAYQAQLGARPVWALLDAQRQQLFVARYVVQQGDPVEENATQIVDAREFLAERRAGEWLTGSGLHGWHDALPAGVHTCPSDRWKPRAGALGQLAVMRCRAGQVTDLWSLKPQYFRPSAAEERRPRRD